jgi:hypothetical protein
MSRKDIELIQAETRRLEALGLVLGMLGLTAFAAKLGGRPRVHASNAQKQEAHRRRQSRKSKPKLEVVL